MDKERQSEREGQKKERHRGILTDTLRVKEKWAKYRETKKDTEKY